MIGVTVGTVIGAAGDTDTTPSGPMELDVIVRAAPGVPADAVVSPAVTALGMWAFHIASLERGIQPTNHRPSSSCTGSCS